MLTNADRTSNFREVFVTTRKKRSKKKRYNGVLKASDIGVKPYKTARKAARLVNTPRLTDHVVHPVVVYYRPMVEVCSQTE